MRTIAITLLAAVALVASSVPVTAQDEEVFERPFGPPLKGYVTDSGVIVLNDKDYCSYVFGSVWGTGKDISPDLVFFYGQKPKQIRRAIKEFARNPTTDEFALPGCVQALNQFNLPQRDPIPMPAWSLDHPVIPAALAPLLTEGTPTPSSAKAQSGTDTADYALYLMGLVPVMDVIMAEVPVEEMQVKYAEAGDQLLAHLMTTDPAECFQDSYVNAWGLYADLSHLSEADEVHEVELLTAYIADDMDRISRGFNCN